VSKILSHLNDYELAICGLDDALEVVGRGASHVLSLVDPGSEEARAGKLPSCTLGCHLILRFHDIIGPAPGWIPPNIKHIESILSFGRSLQETKRISARRAVFHCKMGISRSTAALAIILAQAEAERDEHRIFEQVLQMRPQAWPNSLMIHYADYLLGRGGRLFAALRDLYGRQLIHYPQYKDHLLQIGRGYEVHIAGV
jgi:predicted protein tyrosine phosphatase